MFYHMTLSPLVHSFSVCGDPRPFQAMRVVSDIAANVLEQVHSWMQTFVSTRSVFKSGVWATGSHEVCEVLEELARSLSRAAVPVPIPIGSMWSLRLPHSLRSTWWSLLPTGAPSCHSRRADDCLQVWPMPGLSLLSIGLVALHASASFCWSLELYSKSSSQTFFVYKISLDILVLLKLCVDFGVSFPVA